MKGEAIMPKIVKVGDKVEWIGGFGTMPAQVVTVTGLELTDRARSKYGKPVNEVCWSDVLENRVLFTLSTGNWAYSEQILDVVEA